MAQVYSTVRAIQCALFDEDFNLDEERRGFVAACLATGGDRVAAVKAGRPQATDDALPAWDAIGRQEQ